MKWGQSLWRSTSCLSLSRFKSIDEDCRVDFDRKHSQLWRVGVWL